MTADAIRTPNVFSLPVSRFKPLRVSYDLTVTLHPIEEFESHRLQDAPDLIPPSLSDFEYIDRYLTLFGVRRFWSLRTDGNEIQIHNPGFEPL